MNQVKRTYLLNTLWEIQLTYGYIRDEDVVNISKEYGLSIVEVEGVISFYHFFLRKNSGKYIIYLNNSILSNHNGFCEIKNSFEEATGARLGGTDPTGTFGLYETSCIGLSDRESAALINFYPFVNLNSGKVKNIVDALKAGHSVEEVSDAVEEYIQYLPPLDRRILLTEFSPGNALKKLSSLSPDIIISIIKESGLAGRGGAFFSTGLKWELCRKGEGTLKYIICNADEGEPGSFKDRALLNNYPGLLIEGMIIAGYAVGAEEGIVYLRAEYYWLLPKLQNAISIYRENGLLGKKSNALTGHLFDIRIQMGAGAYICGEETALLESLEGKRGEPRLKTFFPTDKGFLNKPTVINNVETFCTVTRIIESGVVKFLSLGAGKFKGTKLLSIAGDCRKPGIYEIEWGMKVSELLELCEADDPMFIQMSGPSGELISIREKDRTLSCEDIRCEGSVMIFNSKRDLFSILYNYSQFFTYESCGICTPCRAGNPQLLRMIEKLISGKATENDLRSMKEWSTIIKNNSRCGLGNTSPNSLINALTKFPELFQPKLKADNLLLSDFDLENSTDDFNKIINGK